MDVLIEEYLSLNRIFKANNFKLYLVGGTVRDYLLGIPLTDMDAVTDATPEEIEKFLPTANFAFKKYGSVTYKTEKKVKFDITTLREEKGYSDSRHPKEISFVKDLSIDVKRRDFTINALYLYEDLKVIDFVGGQDDLKNKNIKMIGDPYLRLREDPLRILRAIRFASDLSFNIDKELETAIIEAAPELEKLNIEKIKMDLKKAHPSSHQIIFEYFKKYNIKLPDNVLE